MESIRRGGAAWPATLVVQGIFHFPPDLAGQPATIGIKNEG